MLPNNGPLAKQEREEVRALVDAYIKKHKIGQKEVSHQIANLNVSNLNAILNGKYQHGPLDDYLRELNNWMEVDARRRQSKPNRKFVETRIAKRLLSCASKASQGTMIALAHGPTGIGKTMVAHVIAEKFPGAVYLRISSGNGSQSQLRRLLVSHLRMNRQRGRKIANAHLTIDERIFEKLRDSHRLIIIDEAHKLSESALEFLRDIYDECRVPILLLCTKDLLERIREDSDEDHGQFISRVGWVCELTRGYDKMPGGKRPLFTTSDIRKLFENEQIKLKPDGIAYLQDIANHLGRGSLRSCENLLPFAVAVERAVRGIPVGKPVSIGAAVLRKVELESSADNSMLCDLEVRVSMESATRSRTA